MFAVCCSGSCQEDCKLIISRVRCARYHIINWSCSLFSKKTYYRGGFFFLRYIAHANTSSIPTTDRLWPGNVGWTKISQPATDCSVYSSSAGFTRNIIIIILVNPEEKLLAKHKKMCFLPHVVLSDLNSGCFRCSAWAEVWVPACAACQCTSIESVCRQWWHKLSALEQQRVLFVCKCKVAAVQSGGNNASNSHRWPI